MQAFFFSGSFTKSAKKKAPLKCMQAEADYRKRTTWYLVVYVHQRRYQVYLFFWHFHKSTKRGTPFELANADLLKPDNHTNYRPPSIEALTTAVTTFLLREFLATAKLSF